MNNKKKLAIIGLGKMGLLHASLLSTLPEIQLIAICEKSRLVRTFFRKILKDIEIVDDLNQLSNFGLDAIYITTPVASHYHIIKTVYTADIANDIFVEKPLAYSYSEATELCNLANKHGGINMVGYNRRYAVTFARAKKVLEDGKLGNILNFEGYAYSSDFCTSKITVQTQARGGVLRDLGCHVIDIAHWFFGDFDVQPTTHDLQDKELADMVCFNVNTKAGFPGQFKSSRCMKKYRLPEIGNKVAGTNV